jgi:hypothetical protein
MSGLSVSKLAAGPFSNIVATGGVITNVTVGVDTYRVHTFANTGQTSFVVTDTGSNGEIEYLIVAGGGGGGRFFGAGGGGGGVLEGKTKVKTETYTINVGAGGAGAGSANNGLNGIDSSILPPLFSDPPLIAKGGGGGGGNGLPGNSGGSGGGGSRNTGPGGTPITGQGNNGATVLVNDSGGGGGAGQPGVTQKGGDGRLSAITGTATYYGGGGAGPILNNVTVTALGGLGGGGNGASGIASANGTNGLGGGGSGWTGTGDFAGNGGSGIVVIRYPITNNTIKVQSPSYFASPRAPIQMLYYRTDERSQWSAPVGLPTVVGNRVLPLGLTITPKRANSLIVMQWMINGEVHTDTNWTIHLNEGVIVKPGYQGYNGSGISFGQWVGYAAGTYDAAATNDVNSTMENTYLQYSFIAHSTETMTFYPAIKSSTTTAYTFSLNRCAGSLGADSFENAISTGVIMEIAQ